MKRLLTIFALCGAFVWAAAPAADSIAPKKPSLDGVFVITEQSPTLDWWAKVPTDTGAQISPVRKLYRGQPFSLIPFVMGYTLGPDNAFDLSYSLTKQAPDQTRQLLLKDFPIKGHSADARLLQASPQFISGFFEDSDPLGTYHFSFELRDQISGGTIQKEGVVELADWKRPADDLFTAQQLQMGHLRYYAQPDPDWLWLSFLSDEVSFEQSGSAMGFNCVVLAFYKHAFGRYVFLMPKLDEAFDKATPSQRLKIILLYALMEKPEIAAGRLSEDERAYQKQMRAVEFPKPYEQLDTPGEIDWLWGEFFATGEYKPIRRLCEALTLLPYAKAAERVLAAKDEAVSDADVEAFWKGKAFAGFMRSALVNAQAAPLARQYLGYVLEREPMDDNSRALLLVLMRKLWPERYGEAMLPAAEKKQS